MSGVRRDEPDDAGEAVTLAALAGALKQGAENLRHSGRYERVTKISLPRPDTVDKGGAPDGDPGVGVRGQPAGILLRTPLARRGSERRKPKDQKRNWR